MRIRMLSTLALVASALFASALPPAAADEPDARAAMLAAVERYRPGTPVTPELDREVRAAADRLAEASRPPDLLATPEALDGVWLCLYDSRGLLHEAGLRIMSGTRYPDARIPARATTQELSLREGFYRNLVALAAGPGRLPVLYQATARVTVEREAPNVLRVAFSRLDFVPLDAAQGPDDVRRALGLQPDAALSITVANAPSSSSEVVYLEDNLRVNRGADYVSILQRLE
jgi:hypothetical protein